MTLTGATTPGQRRPESNSNAGVLLIPQIAEAGASSSVCLMSYQKICREKGLTSLQRCSSCILQPQPTRRLVGWLVG